MDWPLPRRYGGLVVVSTTHRAGLVQIVTAYYGAAAGHGVDRYKIWTAGVQVLRADAHDQSVVGPPACAAPYSLLSSSSRPDGWPAAENGKGFQAVLFSLHKAWILSRSETSNGNRRQG